MKTIYVGQIDENTDKVYFKSQQVNSVQDKFITNCDEFEHQCMMTLEDSEKVEEAYNSDIDSGKLIVRKCKDCGTYFFINAGEQEWYKNKGWNLPVRCSVCRTLRRNKK